MASDRYCIGCGYLLNRLSKNICPECGRWFDPDDASTFEAESVPFAWRRWARPPSNVHILLTFVFLVGCIVAQSEPGFPGGATLLAMPILAGVLVSDYLGRMVAVRLDRARARRDATEKRRTQRWRWAVAPLATIAVISGVMTRWPLQLRFHVSRTALEYAVDDFQAGQNGDTSKPRLVGLYRVDKLFARGEGNVGFRTSRRIRLDGRVQCAGFEFRPSSPPDEGRYRSLTPRWYVIEW